MALTSKWHIEIYKLTVSPGISGPVNWIYDLYAVFYWITTLKNNKSTTKNHFDYRYPKWKLRIYQM